MPLDEALTFAEYSPNIRNRVSLSDLVHLNPGTSESLPDLNQISPRSMASAHSCRACSEHKWRPDSRFPRPIAQLITPISVNPRPKLVDANEFRDSLLELAKAAHHSNTTTEVQTELAAPNKTEESQTVTSNESLPVNASPLVDALRKALVNKMPPPTSSRQSAVATPQPSTPLPSFLLPPPMRSPNVSILLSTLEALGQQSTLSEPTIRLDEGPISVSEMCLTRNQADNAETPLVPSTPPEPELAQVPPVPVIPSRLPPINESTSTPTSAPPSTVPKPVVVVVPKRRTSTVADGVKLVRILERVSARRILRAYRRYRSRQNRYQARALRDRAQDEHLTNEFVKEVALSALANSRMIRQELMELRSAAKRVVDSPVESKVVSLSSPEFPVFKSTRVLLAPAVQSPVMMDRFLDDLTAGKGRNAVRLCTGQPSVHPRAFVVVAVLENLSTEEWLSRIQNGYYVYAYDKSFPLFQAALPGVPWEVRVRSDMDTIPPQWVQTGGSLVIHNSSD